MLWVICLRKHLAALVDEVNKYEVFQGLFGKALPVEFHLQTLVVRREQRAAEKEPVAKANVAASRDTCSNSRHDIVPRQKRRPATVDEAFSTGRAERGGVELLKGGIRCYEALRLALHRIGKARSEFGLGNSRDQQNVLRPELVEKALKLSGCGDRARYSDDLKPASRPQSQIPEILVIKIPVREKNQQAIALVRRFGTAANGTDDSGLLPRPVIARGTGIIREVRRPDQIGRASCRE